MRGTAQACRRSKMRTSLANVMTKAGNCSFRFAVLIGLIALHVAPAIADESAAQSGAMQLAAKIADADAGRLQNKVELIADYEKTYGNIGTVPARWPVLVRRVLVCQQAGNQTCVQSSMQAIKVLGGANSFALNHLFEVSRFGMTVDRIRGHLRDAETTGDQAAKPVSVPVESRASKPASTPTSRKPEIAHTVAPSVVVAPIAAAPIIAAPIPKKAATSTPSRAAADPDTTNIKTVAPRTLLQKISSRLGKLTANDASAFFLDALFVVVAVALLLILFLFSSMRARKAEHLGRLQALQEGQRLESLLAEQKLRGEHEIWSEQLKSEVALEAQKAHADERMKALQHSAHEAIQKERLRAAEEVKAAQLGAEQIIQLERTRVAEAIKAEQLKTEEAQKSAKSRSDQAIDAYDQMAARELVFAHQHNDELQDALKVERERCEAHELKTEEALQAIEAMKVREAKLLDIIRGEQRVRASEARQAAEKLKAAQQAAAALQSSLVRSRELKADLERRADEAMRMAELRVAEARQRYANPPVPGVQPTPAVSESNAPNRVLEPDTLDNKGEALKDAHSG